MLPVVAQISPYPRILLAAPPPALCWLTQPRSTRKGTYSQSCVIPTTHGKQYSKNSLPISAPPATGSTGTTTQRWESSYCTLCKPPAPPIPHLSMHQECTCSLGQAKATHNCFGGSDTASSSLLPRGALLPISSHRFQRGRTTTQMELIFGGRLSSWTASLSGNPVFDQKWQTHSFAANPHQKR